GRRDRDHGYHFSALRLDGRTEIVAVIMAERIVRIDQRDLLAEVAGDPRGDGAHLRLHVGDARLHAVAVQLARGDVIAFAHHVIRHLELAGCGCGTHHHVREQRAVYQVHLVLAHELLDHLRAARGVGAVILDNDLDRTAVDAAGLVDELYRGRGDAVVPAAIGRADA